jgi:hypothetical protein
MDWDQPLRLRVSERMSKIFSEFFNNFFTNVSLTIIKILQTPHESEKKNSFLRGEKFIKNPHNVHDCVQQCAD